MKKAIPNITFRARLHRILLPALGFTLFLLAMLTVFAVQFALHYNDEQLIMQEIEEVKHVTVQQHTFTPEQYYWSEPHHLFADKRIDPFFLQAFDASGTLLKASENIQAIATIYPQTMLAQGSHELPHNNTTIHIITEAITTQTGNVLGYLQVGRYLPNHFQLMKWIWLILLGITMLVFIGWWFILRRISSYVSQPLYAITTATKDISSTNLNVRIPLPEKADQETVQLTLTLNDLLERLQESFLAVKHFTAHAAHELQTPLTSLLGHIEISLRRPRAPEAYQETLKKLQHDTIGMTQLIRNLLGLARLDREIATSEPQLYNLSALVEELALSCRDKIEEKGIRFETQIMPDIFQQGHPELVIRALQNLLDNANKYTFKGFIRLHLIQQDKIILTIHDTGIGIASEHIQHLTDRFYRIDSAETKEVSGSGLGLALVKEIFERENVLWNVESTLDEGTTFTLIFNGYSE